MPTAQEIYDKLVKDPDLEISAGQTREDAAKGEAQYRARQFMNNVAALSLATASSVPGSMGSPALRASLRERSLSPMLSMTSGVGPIKQMPAW